MSWEEAIGIFIGVAIGLTIGNTITFWWSNRKR